MDGEDEKRELVRRKPDPTRPEEVIEYPEIERKSTDTHYTMTVKTFKDKDCGFSFCSKKKFAEKGNKGDCEVSGSKKEFTRKKDSSMRVYLYCAPKGTKKYENQKFSATKEYQSIRKCRNNACDAQEEEDEIKIPVIPPAPPQNTPPNIPIPDMPILLES